MNVILVGNGKAVLILAKIAEEFRARNVFTSGYYDGDFPLAKDRLDSADLVLLGLNRESRQPSSNEHKVEEALLVRIKQMSSPIPCGVICDEHGFISAPYIARHDTLFHLVFSDSEVPEVFGSNTRKYPADPASIATAVSEFFKTAASRSAAA